MSRVNIVKGDNSQNFLEVFSLIHLFLLSAVFYLFYNWPLDL